VHSRWPDGANPARRAHAGGDQAARGAWAAILALCVALAVACAPAPPPPPVTAPGPTPAPNPPPTSSPTAASGCAGPAPHAGDLCWQDQWWIVKASDTPIGPGPNTFASANVSVQADGLHLTVRPRKGRWTAAELISEARFGYGTYRWTVRLPALDPNVVFGLFTWEDDPAFNHREIDFEAARWGVAADPTNSQFVVQPYASAGNLQRITTPGGSQTVGFTWRPDAVAFTAGGSSWTYTGASIPPPPTSVHMNLWLDAGRPPGDGRPVDVVVSGFTYTP
jgi:endo-1,3-1,4-beta-glycanase ExoK